MGKISEIMLLKQPEHAALVVEVQTDMQGMSKAIGENFVAIDALFISLSWNILNLKV